MRKDFGLKSLKYLKVFLKKTSRNIIFYVKSLNLLTLISFRNTISHKIILIKNPLRGIVVSSSHSYLIIKSMYVYISGHVAIIY